MKCSSVCPMVKARFVDGDSRENSLFLICVSPCFSVSLALRCSPQDGLKPVEIILMGPELTKCQFCEPVQGGMALATGTYFAIVLVAVAAGAVATAVVVLLCLVVIVLLCLFVSFFLCVFVCLSLFLWLMLVFLLLLLLLLLVLLFLLSTMRMLLGPKVC